MIRNMELVITAANSITAVGHNAEMTSASVRAGISRLAESADYYDIEGNPITAAFIDGISNKEDDVTRTGEIAKYCLEHLLERYFQDGYSSDREINLLLGVAPFSRPGPRYEGKNQEIADQLVKISKKWAAKVTLQVITSGNSSVIRCIEIAAQLLKDNSHSLCLVGGIDSLLSLDTLNWFEKAERLKSETFGRNQGFPPGEAAGFMIIETKQQSLIRKTKLLAELVSVGLANEPAPFLSEQPSKEEGLTIACKTALAESFCNPADIEAVFCDLNGEFFRSKEWGYAEIRCFGNRNESRKLWHPADCMGSVGAASGVVLVNIAAVGLSRGWIGKYAMVFCSDDEGECGSVILKSSLSANTH
ncbi:MAG: 3-oxoacyl-ACP synthase [Deltaproteobacteria bacterium]|nr:3-oxoacyl-ACP synthase [Deltaproteobacteria bacterium]